jgi:hypothetical protein
MLPVMTFKRPFQILIFASLGCLLVGFVCWMIGNPDYKHPSAFRDGFNMAGVVLILLGDIGLVASMVSFSRGRSRVAKFGAFALVATVLSVLSFAIFSLEFGVLNFGDSDMPPYQPDTPFERTFDFVWFVVTIGAAVVWSGVIFYAVALLSRFFSRRMT